MYKKIPRLKTFAIFALAIFLVGLAVFTCQIKRRSHDVFFSAFNAGQAHLKVKNYLALVNGFKEVRDRDPFFAGLVLIDGDYHVLAQLGKPGELPFNLSVQGLADESRWLGLLKQAVVYKIPESPGLVIIAWFYAGESIAAFIKIYVLLLVLLGALLYCCNSIDYESYRVATTLRAVEMLSLGIHEMKQFVAYTGELIKYLKNSEGRDAQLEETFIRNYNDLSISVGSMMSIIYFTDKRKDFCKEEPLGEEGRVDLSLVVEACINCYKKRGIDCATLLEHGSLLQIKSEVLFAVIGNIIKNAFCYSSKLVWITSSESEEGLLIAVANTGKMLSERQKKEIIRARLSPDGSKGLGLLIVALWCRRLGASLGVSSSRMSTEFSIFFPRRWLVPPQEASARAEELPSSEPLEVLGTGVVNKAKNIAIIDDIETFCIGLSRELHKLGCAVVSFPCLNDFLDSLARGRGIFDCVIADRHGMGFDAVKDRFPESCRFYGFSGKIVLFSSSVEKDLHDDYRSLGFDLVLAKSAEINWAAVLSSDVIS